jgi:hypothetical protein
MRAWEKRLKAARDTGEEAAELGTNGGAPTAVRRAVGLTSAPVGRGADLGAGQGGRP